MITTEVEPIPARYSRIVRDGDRLVSIVEGSDAPASMRSIREVGTNWIVFRRDDLFRALPLVGRENAQGEYYLNDVFPILIEKGERVSVVSGRHRRSDGHQLARGPREWPRASVRERINARHMANGVTLVDPETTYIDVGRPDRPRHGDPPDDVPVGRDPDRGAGARSGRRRGSSTRRWGRARSSSSRSCASSRIGARAQVGPFARVRPGDRAGHGREGRARSSRSRRPRSARARRCRTCPTSATRRSAGRANIGAGDRDRQLRRVREASDA